MIWIQTLGFSVVYYVAKFTWHLVVCDAINKLF